ncbi:MAG TPA: glucose-1-phosphate thymidylyltransferase [Trueperaceae bacterium]|nr:glucose-1-phosphate thymidylyltransferase [Trueperaceae bacterium]
MKGLILAAGLGTRLRPITSLRPKPTISVANKPLIHYAVDNLVEAGVTDIGVVVSYLTVDSIKETLAGYQGARFTYILQNPPQGLAHAVKVARAFLADDPFVMYLSDNLFERGITSFVRSFDPDKGMNAVCALVPVPEEAARSLGVAVVEDGRITRLVEKPAEPPSTLAVAGVYVFDRHIHAMIDDLEPGAKGEYQITDAIQMLITAGYMVAPVQVTGWWKDTGRPEDILDANRLQLMRLQTDLRGQVEDAKLVGEVVVEEGAVVRNTTIFGPAIIGRGARVENAYIGPFTSIGDDVVVIDAELEYTVVGARSTIRGVGPRIQASLIGEDVQVQGHGGRPSTHRLIVGDESKIILQEL